MPGFRILAAILTIALFSDPARAQGVVTTLAGTEWIFPGDRRALDAPLGRVRTVATDRAGNVYLADPDNFIVARVSPDGMLRVVAGNGLRGVSQDGGQATQSALFGVKAMTLDANGSLYIGDSSRVRRVSPDGVITTVAGSTTPGFGGDGGPATAARLSTNLECLTFDSSGNLYICDTQNYRIRKVTPDGIITTIAGTGQLGFSGDGGAATAASLTTVLAIAVDAGGTIYFSDYGNNRIRRISPNGTINTFLMAGGVQGLAVDTAGNLILTAVTFVRRATPAGAQTSIAGGGNSEESGIPATSALLRTVSSVALDATGNLYIADSGSDRIRKVAPNGTLTAFAGNGRFRYSENGTPTLSTPLHLPVAVSVDPAGNLLIVEGERPRVRRVNARNSTVITLAGNGLRGLGGGIRDGTAALSALFNNLSGAVADSSGNIYLADRWDQRVYRLDPQGFLTTVAGGGTNTGDGIPATTAQLGNINSIALDAGRNIYIVHTVANNAVIRKISSAGLLTTVIRAGAPGFSGDGGPALNAAVNNPQGLSVGRDGSLYFADLLNYRVRKVAPDGTITTVAGNGQRGFSGDGGPAVQAMLFGPIATAVDSEGNLLIADNGRLRRVSSDGIITTLAGAGRLNADGILARDLMQGNISGIAVDSSGVIYFSDASNARVRAILPTPPAAAFSPAEMNFEAKVGGAPPPAQALRMTSAIAGSPFTIRFTSPDGRRWLAASTLSGVMPTTVQITANPEGLEAGVYDASLIVTSPATIPASHTIAVRLAVEADVPPKLAVKTEELSFALVEQAPPETQTISVVNEGGGTLEVTAGWSGGPWLTLSSGTGQATPIAPGSVTARVDITGLEPGAYSGKITITDTASGESAVVAVTLVLAPIRQVILLSQGGLTYTAVARGGVVPPQTFGVLNLGAGVMSWTATASTLSFGPRWLTVSPSSGSTDATSLRVPLVDIAIDHAGLAPGEYYGQIEVRSERGINSPQVVMVVLNVLPEGSDPGPLVRPTGLIFTGVAGSGELSSQEVFVSNLAAAANTYASGRVTSDGGNWFVHLPTDATVAPERSTRLVVQPSAAGLAAGVRRGAITLLFADGVVRTVNLLYLLVPGRGGGGGKSPEAEGCAPTRLLPLFTELGGDFTVSAGWPLPINVRVVDDCGDPMTSGTVVATFSNGDPAVPLASLKDGRWAGTWQARNTRFSQVTVTVTAEIPDPRLRGTAQLAGALRSSTAAPAVDQVVSAVSRVSKAPLAPGSIVSIMGSRLADAESSSETTPLPTELAGASVLFAGQMVPLLSVSDGVINAQLPYDIAVNTRHQLVVRRGASYTVPGTVTVAAAGPAIFTQDRSGRGQAMIFRLAEDGARTLADAGAPVQFGDRVVIQCAGLGAVDPPVPAGAAPPADPPARVVTPVTLIIGGVQATVESAILASGTPGLYEVRAVVPEGVVAGDAVEVVLTAAGQSSAPATVAVR